MIDIRDFKFNIVCDFDNRNIAKHSIGMVNAPSNLRTNICTQCLIEIITEGLKRLTDEEKSEILKDYIPESKELSEEEREELCKEFLRVKYEEHQNSESENQFESGQASINQECSSDKREESQNEEDSKEEQVIDEAGNGAQKFNKEADAYNPVGKPRDELISKAKGLGVEGKIATFTNKMLENEIEKKLSKLGGK